MSCTYTTFFFFFVWYQCVALSPHFTLMFASVLNQQRMWLTYHVWSTLKLVRRHKFSVHWKGKSSRTGIRIRLIDRCIWYLVWILKLCDRTNLRVQKLKSSKSGHWQIVTKLPRKHAPPPPFFFASSAVWYSCYCSIDVHIAMRQIFFYSFILCSHNDII